jgi:hypothetical protein
MIGQAVSATVPPRRIWMNVNRFILINESGKRNAISAPFRQKQDAIRAVFKAQNDACGGLLTTPGRAG